MKLTQRLERIYSEESYVIHGFDLNRRRIGAFTIEFQIKQTETV